MTNISRPKLLFLILLLLIIVQSCAEMNGSISPKSSAQALAHAKQLIDAGEYQKAIDAYDVEYRKHPQDQTLVREYVKSLEDMKSAADKASDKEDFASAGRN
ncbi:MAG TPA: hypothetical protein VLZ07_05350, partial [Syntrophales bacterium]|nr:hypothetical protein [Syntrophales bacterium]